MRLQNPLAEFGRDRGGNDLKLAEHPSKVLHRPSARVPGRPARGGAGAPMRCGHLDGTWSSPTHRPADVDDSIGRIVETVEALGELDNTIFVFTSENGIGRELTSSTLPMRRRRVRSAEASDIPAALAEQGSRPIRSWVREQRSAPPDHASTGNDGAAAALRAIGILATGGRTVVCVDGQVRRRRFASSLGCCLKRLGSSGGGRIGACAPGGLSV